MQHALAGGIGIVCEPAVYVSVTVRIYIAYGQICQVEKAVLPQESGGFIGERVSAYIHQVHKYCAQQINYSQEYKIIQDFFP